MRGGVVWRRAEPPMHACIRMSRKTRALIHKRLFYPFPDSSRHASGGGEIHQDVQVVKRRPGAGVG